MNTILFMTGIFLFGLAILLSEGTEANMLIILIFYASLMVLLSVGFLVRIFFPVNSNEILAIFIKGFAVTPIILIIIVIIIKYREFQEFEKK